MTAPTSDFEQIGGELALAPIIDELVDRFAADFIIGFHFVGKDLAQVKRRELSFAAAHLGAGHRYVGRPIGQVHQPLRINRGQFRRRLAIVRTVLAARGVPEAIAARWVEAEARLELVVAAPIDCGVAANDAAPDDS